MCAFPFLVAIDIAEIVGALALMVVMMFSR
jgi:hypothetical protein